MTSATPSTAVPFRATLVGGKYVLGDCIGAGGMGRVYRAHQPDLDRTVAIKILHRSLADDPRIARHFRTEAIAAASLSHPNTVAVLDYSETDEGVPFLVMEYVPGDTLAQIVRRDAPLDVDRAVAITLQILEALGDAHARGIVHADVKCENVLVDATRGHGERAKLVDFGLARIAYESLDQVASDDRFISGTPEYMAPEVIRGAPPTPLSDGYSVGAMLYELLTGATPFGGGDFDEVLHRHLHDVVVPPSLRCPELAIPRQVEDAILRALEKEPRRRFLSMGAFASSLFVRDATKAVRARRCTPTRAGGDAVSTAVLPLAGNEERGRRRPRDRREMTEEEATARRQIGDAIVRGDMPRIAGMYLTLAELLRAAGHPRDAITELEESLDVLCGGAFPCAEANALSPILLALLPLYVELGDRAGAARTRGRLDHSSTLTMDRP